MYREWGPYVSAAERRAKSRRYAAKLVKGGRKLCPVEIAGRTIAETFWGQAWCENLEGYSDFDNRLPRGRTYVRNGSVIDLQIERGLVKALVSGSDIYHIKIEIKPLGAATWKAIKHDCGQSIDSLLDLLQGRFAKSTMERLCRPQDSLFPAPKEIKFQCSCPDSATMCKHIAAVLYGVGSRLDNSPESLFTLRGVEHHELIAHALADDNLDRALGAGDSSPLATGQLGELFGIDLEVPASGEGDQAASPTSTAPRKGRTTKPSSAKKTKKTNGSAKRGAAGRRRPVKAPTASTHPSDAPDVGTATAPKPGRKPRKSARAATPTEATAAVSRRQAKKPR
jgi:uncharacterized Zn finger protein